MGSVEKHFWGEITDLNWDDAEGVAPSTGKT